MPSPKRSSRFKYHSSASRPRLEILEARENPAAFLLTNLDPSFGIAGKVTTDFGGDDQAHSILVDANHKILVAGSSTSSSGHFAMARYLPSGVLDTSFGTGGKFITDQVGGVTGQSARSIALDGLGRILVAGHASNGDDADFALARYTSTGAPDATFGTQHGRVSTDFSTSPNPFLGTEDYGEQVLVDGSGRIVVVGTSTTKSSPTTTSLALARYTSTGELDTTFDRDGKATPLTLPEGYALYGAAVDRLGEIIVTVTVNVSSHQFLELFRFTPTGQWDTSFIGSAPFDSFDNRFYSNRMLLDSSNRVIVAGTHSSGSNEDFALLRFNLGAQLDSSFGTGGKVITDFNGKDDQAFALALDKADNIFVAGSTFIASNTSDFALARYTSNGTLIGTAMAGFGTSDAFAFGLAVDDGKAILAGPGSEDSSSQDFALARFQIQLVGQNTQGDYAGAAGTNVTVFNSDGSTFGNFTPFTAAESPNGVRVAIADINGDGVPDLVAVTAPGVPAQLRAYDGRTESLSYALSIFEGFTGGAFIALGDINGDGKADLVVTPDQGGGPRVSVFNGPDGAVLDNFFGIEDPNFRGGARATVGDVNGDGIADIVVSAGFGGGPRIAGYDGKSLRAGVHTHLFSDFFLFESTLRNGAYVTIGDLNGDGFGDIIGGAGPGGGPRVYAVSGQKLVSDGSLQSVANFFAGNTNLRGGVRVAAKDLDGDGLADLVTGSGDTGDLFVYLGSDLRSTTTPKLTVQLTGITDGVFVG